MKVETIKDWIKNKAGNNEKWGNNEIVGLMKE